MFKEFIQRENSLSDFMDNAFLKFIVFELWRGLLDFFN